MPLLNKLNLYILFSLLGSIVYSQDIFDAEKTYYDAEFLELYQRYEEALPLYLELIENDFVNANVHYKIGNTYLHIPGQKTRAISYLEQASESASFKYRKERSFKEKRAPAECILLLGEAYQVNNQLDLALDSYFRYKKLLDNKKLNTDLVNRRIVSCEFAKNFMEKPIDSEKMRLNLSDPGVSNYRAVFSEDGESMVFMRKRKYYEAIFFSKKLNRKWLDPVNITAEVESNGRYQVSSLSPDGLILFLVYYNSTDYDLYQSYFNNGRWSKAVKMGVSINTEANEVHAVLSPLDKALYFVSDKKGGFGGFDIYRSRSLGDGSWEMPENIGSAINTSFDETTPFFSDEGKSLSFSSNGHENMGGYDVFFSDIDQTGKWNSPENYGSPLNTTDDNVFFVPGRSRYSGTMTSFDSIPGSIQSLFQWEFYSEFNPRKIKLAGTILYPEKFDPEQNELEINIQDENGETHSLMPDKTGLFTIDLSPGMYLILAKGENIKDFEEDVFIKENVQPEVIRLELKSSESLPVEKSYTINSILFGFDSSALTENSKKELDLIIKILEIFPKIRITLKGYTDSVGPYNYNQKLSSRRANSTADYLKNKGILTKRVLISFYGEDHPVAINRNADNSDCPEGRKYNRRVSFSLEGSGIEQVQTNPPAIPDGLEFK